MPGEVRSGNKCVGIHIALNMCFVSIYGVDMRIRKNASLFQLIHPEIANPIYENYPRKRCQ